MKKSLATLCLLFAAAGLAGASHVLINPTSVSTSTTGDLWPVSNLIQGPGSGYDAADPHNQLGPVDATRWVTGAPGGFPSDFIAVAGAPVLTFDLGADTLINSINTWGYSTTNANGVQDFSLRFATDADGAAGFGTTIADTLSLSMTIDDVAMQTNAFGTTYNARYVEFTALSSFFSNGGNGPPAGGDRVGLGEVAFGIPEPSAGLLGLLGLGLMLRRRR